MNTEKAIQDIQSKTDEVLEAIARMKAQIDYAKVSKIETGEYADPAWFAKVNSALRFKQIEHQKLIREAAQLKKEKNRQYANDIHRVFVDLAKTRLNGDVFSSLLNQATEIVEWQKRQTNQSLDDLNE